MEPEVDISCNKAVEERDHHITHKTFDPKLALTTRYRWIKMEQRLRESPHACREEPSITGILEAASSSL